MKRTAGPLARAVSILGYVVAREEAPTLAQLSRALELPKPTTHRLVNALERVGLLRKDPLTRQYRAGETLETLAFGAIRAGVGHSARRFRMQALADLVGERVNLGVLAAAKTPHVAWADSVSPFREGTRLDVDPGLRLPLHCTANGKLLLACAAEGPREAMLHAAAYRSYTKSTITSARALRAELAKIREQDFAEDAEEFIEGVICLAVPVRNERAQAVAGLAIMAPVARLSLERAREYLPALRACAEALSRELVAPGRESTAEP